MIDEAYVAACKAQGFYPVGYYGHNIHFLWTSSEMEGRYQAAIDAARRLVKTIDVNGLATAMPLAELYGFTPVTTLLRFGKWDEVLAEPPPPPALKLDTAMWLYARGFAQIAKRDLKGAAATRDTLEALSKEDLAAYDAAMLPARQMMSMALNLLNGEMLRASGDLTRAIIDFQAAQTIEKGLPYMEPPYWHQPVAHILGAALLEAKRPGEAERVYRESLAIYRRDGWALFGLAQALEAQGKTTAAQDARKQYAAVWTLADVKLTSSRF
jgi:tetratricopeptide (TPR) repeat protein